MEFNYIPNQKKKKGPKDIMSNVKELPKNMMEKIKKTVEEMKKKGQKLTPNLKKLLTKALAGSLVAGMLFVNMVGCDFEKNVTNMNQLFPEVIATEMSNDPEYNLDAYNSKKEEFMQARRPHQVHLMFDDLPNQYFMDKYNIDEDEAKKRTMLCDWFCTDKELYIGGMYIDDELNSEEITILGKKTERELVYKVLFKYELDEEIINSLINCDQKGSVNKEVKNFDRGYTMTNYDVAFLIDYIVNHYDYKSILSESYVTGAVNTCYGTYEDDGYTYSVDANTFYYNVKDNYLGAYTVGESKKTGRSDDTRTYWLMRWYVDTDKMEEWGEEIPEIKLKNGLPVVEFRDDLEGIQQYFGMYALSEIKHVGKNTVCYKEDHSSAETSLRFMYDEYHTEKIYK